MCHCEASAHTGCGNPRPLWICAGVLRIPTTSLRTGLGMTREFLRLLSPAVAIRPPSSPGTVFSPVKKISFVSPKRQRRKINLCGTTLVAAPRRPLRPTIRGRGLITALRRPCLLRAFSRSAGSSGVIFAADPVSASHQTGGSLGTDSLGLLIPILAFALYCLSFYHKSRFCQQENYTIPK